MSGTWNNPTYASYHTQSTRTRSFGGGATGDLDDRFDMILCSNAVSQEGGVTFLPGSYVAFGNDGLHYNDSINKMPNTAVSQSIANALHYASDHLPVIASFIFHPASPAGGAKAANISLTSGNNQSASINTTLSNLFVVKVTDATGAGVHGTTVSFAITSAPSDQTGALLSLSSAVTDASGEASTRLTLGNKVGDYLVSATAVGLNGSPIFFVATASAGQPGSIGIESGNFQTGPNKSTLREPMVVRVVDAGGNPVQGAAVSFAITSAPQSAVGQVLSVETASTDQAGRASTFLTLGSRSGTYAVTATSVGLSGTPISFFATAFGGAEEIREASGNNQTATTKAELQQPFVVIVVDVLGNAVPGVPVAFSIASVPVGAVGQSLSIESTMTDQNGQALSVLRLGDKLGAYGVIASSPGLAGNPVVFVAFASSLSSVDRVEQISARLHLLPNYPNPFNPTTTIEFTLPENGRAVLRVFNALGEEVAALFDGEAEAGRIHLAQFDAGRLSSGVYYARLEFKNRQLVRRVLLLR